MSEASPALDLRPLLEPASVAVIGASGRPGRPGYAVVHALRRLGYAGTVHPVTPTYDAIEGWPCLPAAADLPAGGVDLAIVAGGAARAAEQLADALAAGARAALVLANTAVPDPAGGSVSEHLARLAAAAAIPLLGPNTLGFVNVARGVAATWTPPVSAEPGPVALVTQSGSTYSYANNLDPRLRFSLTAHAGQEVSVGVADLVRYALDLEGTRVVGLYLETMPAPDALAAALAEAASRDVPVVAIRPGRSERSRRQIETHAGRLAGSDAAFEALFARHGVLRTHTVDELWATIALLASPRRAARGGLGAILCSGGARALLLDDGADLGVPFAELGQAAAAELRSLLAPGTPAENPVDIWDGEADLATHATRCLEAVVGDPDTALALAFTDFGVEDEAGFPESFAAACVAAAATTEKPVVAATYTSRQFQPDVLEALADAGIPVLDGMRNAVHAVRGALAHRDRVAPDAAPAVDATALAARLADPAPLGEAETLALLGAHGVPVPATTRAAGVEAAVAAAEAIGYPVVLKTTAASHKSDVGGVRLGLADAEAVRAAAIALGALSPDIVVARQVAPGVELAVGVVRDPLVGPLLMVGAGGVLVELLADRRFLLAPAGPREIEAALRELRIWPLLAGARGAPPCDVGALADAISRISALAAAAGPSLAELDLNPIIAGPDGCTVVDALVVRPEEESA